MLWIVQQMSFHAISKHQCQIKKREWKWKSSCSLRESRNNWLNLNYDWIFEQWKSVVHLMSQVSDISDIRVIKGVGGFILKYRSWLGLGLTHFGAQAGGGTHCNNRAIWMIRFCIRFINFCTKKEMVKMCNILTNIAVKCIDCIFNIYLSHGQYWSKGAI